MVEDLRSRDLIESVCIVAEDRHSLCIDALERFLAARVIPVRMQSGMPEEDVFYLKHARHVI